MGLLLIGSPDRRPRGSTKSIQHLRGHRRLYNQTVSGLMQLCCLSAAEERWGIRSVDVFAKIKHSIGHLLGRCVAAQP